MASSLVPVLPSQHVKDFKPSKPYLHSPNPLILFLLSLVLEAPLSVSGNFTTEAPGGWDLGALRPPPHTQFHYGQMLPPMKEREPVAEHRGCQGGHAGQETSL